MIAVEELYKIELEVTEEPCESEVLFLFYEKGGLLGYIYAGIMLKG